MSDTKEPRDRRLIASAALIGLIVVAGIIVVIVRLVGGDDEASPTASPTTSQAAESSSVCGLPDGDQTMPTEAPAADWNLAGRAAVPSNPSFGPAKTDGGLHACFAHNPTGAIFAAANYYADTTNPEVSPAALSSRIFEDANSDKAGAKGDANGPVYQVSGFRVEDATKDRTTVALVVKSPDGPTAGEQAAITFTLGWQDGDWKIVVPPTGQPPTTAIATLAGYTPWSGV